VRRLVDNHGLPGRTQRIPAAPAPGASEAVNCKETSAEHRPSRSVRKISQ